MEESFTTTVGQLELNDRDIAAGLSVAVEFKTPTAPYAGASLQMEFLLNQSYPPGTKLDILSIVNASEIGDTFTQGLEDLPITTYVGPATVTNAGNRAVGMIPTPSGKYIVDEPLDSLFSLDEVISGKQVNPKDVKPSVTQDYELKRAPGTTAGTIPVVLVHGIHGEDTAEKNWQGLYQYLDKNPNQFDEWLFIYDTTIPLSVAKTEKPGNSITDHAIQLANQINSKITGSEPIVLIAHSMGGLVCRDAMQNISGQTDGFNNRIAALLTLGTPHHGSPFAHPLWSKFGFQEDHYDIIGDDFFELNFARIFDGRAVFGESQRNGDLDTVVHFFVQKPWEQNALDLIWDNFDDSMPVTKDVQKKL